MMIAQTVSWTINETFIHISIPNATPQAYAITAGCMVGFGLLWCFLGYRLFRMFVGFVGLCAGAVLGANIAAAIINVNPATITTIASVPVGIWIGIGVGAFAGLMLFSLLYIVGIFLMGVGMGGVIALLAMVQPGLQPTPNQYMIALAIGVGAGIITIFLRKPIIIILSSVTWAPVAVIGMAHFFGAYPLSRFSQPVTWQALYRQNQIMVFTMAGLAIGGILVQFFVTSPKKKTAANDDV